MNSVQVSDSDDRPGNLVLGNSQYTFPEGRQGLIYAAVMHHPLDWYMDKAEAKKHLHKRARLILVGHEHVPSIEKTKDEFGNEWICIYSGATTPPDSPEHYSYTYNWIETSLFQQDGCYNLRIEIFPRSGQSRSSSPLTFSGLGGENLPRLMWHVETSSCRPSRRSQRKGLPRISFRQQSPKRHWP